jgi:hypothetical protein
LEARKFVAVAFLTQQELDRVGVGFYSYLPMQHDDLSSGLIAKLDKAEAAPLS